MNTKVLLLLTLTVCVTLAAQMHKSQRCLCRRVRNRFGSPREIEDIQIYPPSSSCDYLEIIVRLKNGLQYCLDPQAQKVQKLLAFLLKKDKPRTTTVEPSTTTEISQVEDLEISTDSYEDKTDSYTAMP